jgi:hypothetical protein
VSWRRRRRGHERGHGELGEVKIRSDLISWQCVLDVDWTWPGFYGWILEKGDDEHDRVDIRVLTSAKHG